MILTGIVDFMNNNTGVADWVSSIATFIATTVALYISIKKPKVVKFSLETGNVFHQDTEFKRFSLENLKHKFTDNAITLNYLNVNVLNIDLMNKVIFESGIIVKGDFRKEKFGNYLSKTLAPNNVQYVDFGNNRIGVGHIVTLKSYRFNPFISSRSVTFKVYLKDSSGKLYMSNYFKLHDFN